MATGDLKNNLRKLKTELRLIKYDKPVSWDQISVGLTEPLLPVLHYLFADYSCELTSYIAFKGYEMFGKSDLRFVEVIYKILINEFSTKPMLTKQQFFAVGFTEIKVIFVTKIISLCRIKNIQIVSKLCKNKKHHAKSKEKSTNLTISPTEMPKQSPLHDSVDFKIEHHGVVLNPTSNNHEMKQEEFHNNSILDLTTEPEEAVEFNKDFDISDESNIIFLTNKSNEFSQELPVLKSVYAYKDDITEIEDEDELNVTEEEESVVEILKEDLPKFTIQKHYIPEVKVIQDPNAEVVTTQGKMSCSKCNQCSKNEVDLQELTDRLSTLEKKFSETLSANNGLSAKVILLETKLKFLETTSQSNTIVNNQDFVEKNREIAVPANSHNQNENIKKTKPYSPIKYSDDEVITKDFRPLRMKDIRGAQGISNNKENNFTMSSSQELRKKELSATNVSFDSKTKDTIANVQKYLHETDMLLFSK